ncbi:flagellar motor switch protein FliG [Candidatus Arsenophonus nilaparvatae]|uniref:flagellar motor switch protein FliG n=1 Tax=Candidatus Arsenophonus nilaparvatae TaxID=1247023 RepID=UPI000509A55A|nr:flagellar motor switch protein FliG [Candidatus Arsenophonus nilaparvatae]
MSFNGIEKSAVMLMSVGEKLAAEIFKHLNSGEVQKLSVAISNLGQISNHQLTDILSEFEENATQYAAINVNTKDYLNSVLIKALGEEHANSLLEDIFETKETVTGIDKLNFMAPEVAAEMIRDEHPQIIAATLVHLKRTQAAEILALLDEELRHDVVLRIATFGGIQPSALAELTEVLNSLLDEQNIKRSKMGGIRTAAEIINLMKSQQEKMVISAVKEYDDELAQKIIAEMFLFEDLIEMDDRSMQRLLQEVENDSLVIALKSCSQTLRDHFLNNMSQRAAEIMRDDLDSQLPVRLSQVETEQKAILSIVRRLSENGEIALNGGDDRYV